MDYASNIAVPTITMMIKTQSRATQLFYACIFLLLLVDSLKCNCCTSNQYHCQFLLPMQFFPIQHFMTWAVFCFYYSTKLLFTLFKHLQSLLKKAIKVRGFLQQKVVVGAVELESVTIASIIICVHEMRSGVRSIFSCMTCVFISIE